MWPGPPRSTTRAGRSSRRVVSGPPGCPNNQDWPTSPSPPAQKTKKNNP
jgi:hypothetical protein